MRDEIALIKTEMDTIKKVFLPVIKRIQSFNITDPKILPYGLRAHTRSVSWIVEQVISQQTKYHAKALGLTDVDIDLPDTCLHDCILQRKGQKFFVNIKVHNVSGKARQNDIAAVEKLYMQYRANPGYRLLYACFGIRFENVKIDLDPVSVHLFSPQFLPIYVNPRNDKIQAHYHHKPEFRSRRDFLRLLRDNSKSIVLKE